MNYKLFYIQYNTETFSFLGKQIDDRKWFLIPLDHRAAYLISNYNRVLATINANRIQINNIKIDVDYIAKINDTDKATAIDTLIDFIDLGNRNTEIIKKTFLKEYMKKKH